MAREGQVGMSRKASGSPPGDRQTKWNDFRGNDHENGPEGQVGMSRKASGSPQGDRQTKWNDFRGNDHENGPGGPSGNEPQGFGIAARRSPDKMERFSW